MADEKTYRVRMERQPHRNAVGRLQQAYQKLSRARQPAQPETVEEVTDEPGSSTVRPSVDPAAGAGSDD